MTVSHSLETDFRMVDCFHFFHRQTWRMWSPSHQIEASYSSMIKPVMTMYEQSWSTLHIEPKYQCMKHPMTRHMKINSTEVSGDSKRSITTEIKWGLFNRFTAWTLRAAMTSRCCWTLNTTIYNSVTWFKECLRGGGRRRRLQRLRTFEISKKTYNFFQ
jgi:hypothetical protein